MVQKLTDAEEERLCCRADFIKQEAATEEMMHVETPNSGNRIEEVYIKNEVSDAEMEYVIVKEEPINVHQTSSSNVPSTLTLSGLMDEVCAEALSKCAQAEKSSKCSSPAARRGKPSAKKKPKSTSFDQKRIVIKRHENRKQKSEISEVLLTRKTALQTMCKELETEKERHLTSTSIAVQPVKTRRKIFFEMERQLHVWIQGCDHNHIPLCTNIIRIKALEILKTLEDNDVQSENKDFVCSLDWFEKFKKKNRIRNVRIQGKAASADREAAEKFVVEFRNFIENEKYDLRQVFNVDETVLYWKRMPSNELMAKEDKFCPEYKESDEKVTLLLGGNAEGDFKLRPFLINPAQDARTLRCHDQGLLPVALQANRTTRVTKSIFEYWFASHFCPAAKKYCKENNLPFKVLLLLDDDSSHPLSLGEVNKNVRVVFLSSTTPLQQPMDLGVIAAFKAIYLRTTFEKASTTIASSNSSVAEFWKKFTVQDGINNIQESWNQLGASNMRAVWKELLPKCTNNFDECDQTVINALNGIEILANTLELEASDFSNVRNVVKSHNEAVRIGDVNTNEVCVVQLDDEDDQQQEESLKPEMTLKQFNDLFKTSEMLKQQILASDPDFQRSSRVCKKIDKSLRRYSEMYKERKIAVQKMVR